MGISRANKSALIVGGLTLAVSGGVFGGLSGITAFGVEEIIEAAAISTASTTSFSMIARLFTKQVEKENREVKELKEEEVERSRRENPQNAVEKWVRKEELVNLEAIGCRYRAAGFIARANVGMQMSTYDREMRGLLSDVEALFSKQKSAEAREMVYGFIMGYSQHRDRPPWVMSHEAVDLKKMIDPNLGADGRAWVEQRIDEVVRPGVW